MFAPLEKKLLTPRLARVRLGWQYKKAGPYVVASGARTLSRNPVLTEV
jgi:hypothetical protein